MAAGQRRVRKKRRKLADEVVSITLEPVEAVPPRLSNVQSFVRRYGQEALDAWMTKLWKGSIAERRNNPLRRFRRVEVVVREGTDGQKRQDEEGA